MPYNQRDPGGNATAAHQQPVPRSLAILVLMALVALWAMRHIFGAITVQAGTK
jgi:hypothetical protein